MNYSPAIAVQHHMLSIVPAKAKLLRNFMKNCRTDIGEFSRSYRFVKVGTADNAEAKKSVCRAVILLQSALSDHQLERIRHGK